MKTLGMKVSDEMYDEFVEKCKKGRITPSEKLRDLVENEYTYNESINLERVFEHIKDCSRCLNTIIDKGYVLVSLERLRKYGIEIVPNRNVE
jgi:hypothetical protein